MINKSEISAPVSKTTVKYKCVGINVMMTKLLKMSIVHRHIHTALDLNLTEQ